VNHDSHQLAVDTALAAAGSKATNIGAGTTVVSWALSSEFGVLVGIVLGVLGLCVNIFFKWRQDKRENLEHLERLKDLRDET
jgi:cytochrome c biogenesis factor